MSSDPHPPWLFGRVAGTGWEWSENCSGLHRGSSSPFSWLLSVAVGFATLLWPEGCCWFKAFQDKQLYCSFQTFKYVKQLLVLGAGAGAR